MTPAKTGVFAIWSQAAQDRHSHTFRIRSVRNRIRNATISNDRWNFRSLFVGEARTCRLSRSSRLWIKPTRSAAPSKVSPEPPATNVAGLGSTSEEVGGLTAES